jgi:hypothetical protein
MAFTAFTYGDPQKISPTFSFPIITMAAPWFVVTKPVAIYGEILQSGTIGSAYSETISVINGTSPYTFAISSGTLPTGLSLGSSTGVISGTPTTAGTSTFNVQVTDASGYVATNTFQIIVSSGGSSTSGNYGFVS